MSDFNQVTLNCFECGTPIPCPRKLFLLGPKVLMSRSLKKDAGDGFTVRVELKGSKPCCEDCSKKKTADAMKSILERGLDFQEDEDWPEGI